MLYERFCAEGVLPERALVRLKKEGIAVYHAKKVQKNRLLFSVKREDIEKIFAIFPKVCYNESERASYTVFRIGAERLKRTFDFFKKRLGVILGAAVFFLTVAVLENYVFKIEVVGEPQYRREALLALDKNGITLNKRYDERNADKIRAELTALNGVGFCSVQKRGTTVVVEIRKDPFHGVNVLNEPMKSVASGTLVEITTLRGTPLKKAGESVTLGEALVGNYFLAGVNADERVEVAPIARARIMCEYALEVEAETEKEAFSKAYLAAGLTDRGELIEKKIEQKNGLYSVWFRYVELQTINF